MGAAPLTLWTIGHSTRTIDEFVALLADHAIRAVADVRRFPGSRKHPQFGADALRKSLGHAGVEYAPFPELGGRRRPQPDSHNTAWRNESFRGYADYMETREFREGIDRLLALARRKSTAIMCAEAVWWRCHRSMIADHLKASGVLVLHITGRPGERMAEPHPYTSAAHVKNGTLSYCSAGRACDMGEDGRAKFASVKSGKRARAVSKKLRVGDHVTWNSEAGRVGGTIIKVHTSDFEYKGYTHHASKDDPQYEIKSDKTDHISAHKGAALTKTRR